MKLTLGHLRHHAVSHSLFRPTGLRQVFEQLGFVQADPIRAPARAQDLILRHRAKDYRVGELEARYLELGLEEDFLYAYGFMPQSTWRLLHPRRRRTLTGSEKRILEIVTKHQRIHPRELEAFLGRKRTINAWGGYSKATTTSLHRLHYLGFLRVAGREKGIRLYAPTPDAQHEPLDPAVRLRRLVLVVATILAPSSERSLRTIVQYLSRAARDLNVRRAAIQTLLDAGETKKIFVLSRGYFPARSAVRLKRMSCPRIVLPQAALLSSSASTIVSTPMRCLARPRPLWPATS